MLLSTCGTSPGQSEEKQPQLFVLCIGVEGEPADGERDRYAADAEYVREAALRAAGPYYGMVHSRVLGGAARRGTKFSVVWPGWPPPRVATTSRSSSSPPTAVWMPTAPMRCVGRGSER